MWLQYIECERMFYYWIEGRGMYSIYYNVEQTAKCMEYYIKGLLVAVICFFQ